MLFAWFCHSICCIVLVEGVHITALSTLSVDALDIHESISAFFSIRERMVAVIVSFNCQCDTIEDHLGRVSVRDCLAQVGCGLVCEGLS